MISKRSYPTFSVLLACLAVACSAFSPARKLCLFRRRCDCQYQLRMINNMHRVDRGRFVKGGIGTVALSFLYSASSHAMGLVKFPCREPLANTYHFIRAGQSMMEEQDIWSTNPLFLTNREAALSPEGVKQVEEASRFLKEQDVVPSIVRYSLAAHTMDTTNILGRELKLGRDRLVPEFNYMDPRAVGKWDMLPLSSTETAVWALDVDEAGAEGQGGRPPPNEDGTPHETLADQAVRLRQLLSVLETQYSGDTVVLVFPDGTGPALLSAMIAGVPYNRAHELEYQPGEIRLNVTIDTTLAILKNKNREEYKSAITTGRKELKRLREMIPDEVISVKDQQLENDRLEMEEFMRKKEELRLAKEAADRSARDARERQIEDARKRSDFVGGGDDNTRLNSPVLLGVVGASVVGTALAAVGSNSDKDDASVSSDMVSPAANATETEQQSQVLGDLTIMERPLIDIPEIRLSDGEVSSSMSENNEQFVTSINGDRQTFPSPPRSRDPVKAADEAMQEYMDSDDGGNAWLGVMSDLMLQEDKAVDEDDDDVS